MSDSDFEESEWPFGGKGEPEDVPVPSGTARQIRNVLARADEQAGEYSFGGQAETLPAAPRLVVNEVGSIPVPITAELAQKLIEKCSKSPFGQNLETKMDEAVRQSWQLEPTQVSFENMAWQSGMEKLGQVVADRLGYRDIPLQCVLYKLLVYGEGGHFVKHQDTEKEDGMIATLVVQLPSSHEGGDLVVYRGGEVRHRHDFGKADGTSAFLPHYAVHYADAEHALEKVTRGYRLALVYSICLPPTMRHLEKAHDKPLSEDLAGLIGNMDDEDEPFALLLSHEYTVKSIQDLGTGALKGVDSARFHALKEANALVPTAKQLQFFIVRLTHKIEFDPGWDMDWKPSKHKESMRWYSISGESLGRIRQSTKFNFLNPGQETLSQLWIPHGVQKEEGYMGNEGPSRNTKYARYAIVAWPSAKHAEHAAKIMPLDAAVEVFHAQKPVDAATLRAFMNDWNARLRGEGKYDFLPGTLSIKFTRLFCELAVEAGDSELVRDFFANHCPKLGNQKDNGSLVTVTREIARTFDWKDFGKAFSDFLDQNISTYGDEEGYSSMGLELLILDGLDSGVARDALFSLVAKKSAELTTEDLCSCKVVGLLLKWVVHNSTNSTVDKVTNTFKQLDPSLLRPALLENALECFNGGDANDDKVGLLPLLVSKRIGWLKNQIEMFDKPFSWQMPDAQFSDNAKVEEFLRSPAATMTMTKTKGVRKFKGFQDANNYAAKWTHEAQVNASFKMEASAIYADAVVTITKTPKWFAEGQHTLGQYKAELDRLLEYAVKTNSSNCKRARLE